MKKHLLNLFLLAIFLGSVTISCTGMADPAGSSLTDPVLPTLTEDTGFWYDTTNSVPSDVMATLEAESEAIQADGFQLAGVFFKDSASEPSDICTKWFNQNKLGDADLDNGIGVCLFLEKEGGNGDKPAIWISTGLGIEATLTDIKTGQLLDKYFVPARSDGKWQQGTIDTVKAIHRFLLDPNNAEFVTQEKPFNWTLLIIIIVIVVLLVALDVKTTGGEFTAGAIKAAAEIGLGGTSGGGGAGR